jgi:hypothetical protein
VRAFGAEDDREQASGDREEFGDLWRGDAVVDVARATVRDDETVSTQHGEVLGEVGGLESRGLLQLGDLVLLGVGEQFEQTDAQGVREALEESGLHLVERTFPVI